MNLWKKIEFLCELQAQADINYISSGRLGMFTKFWLSVEEKQALNFSGIR